LRLFRDGVQFGAGMVADSGAFRMRRSRKHADGDHSLCVPGRCQALDEQADMVEQPRSAESTGLSVGGQRLYDEVALGNALSPMTLVILLEACRIVDRLDQLDRQLYGGDWLRFRRREDELHVVVHVDRALSEAREQATALRGLLADVEQAVAHLPVQSPSNGVLADFAARLEAKRRQFSTTYTAPDAS
jgi:hypothetical protein